jgi:hypothetical protein
MTVIACRRADPKEPKGNKVSRRGCIFSQLLRTRSISKRTTTGETDPVTLFLIDRADPSIVILAYTSVSYSELELSPGEVGSGEHERQGLFCGWRFGAFSCAISVTVVFVINTGITIWAVSKDEFSGDDMHVLFERSCTKSQSPSIWILSVGIRA